MHEYISKVQELNEVIERLCIVPSECEYEDIFLLLDQIYLTPEGELNADFRHEYASISGKMRELNGESKDGISVFSLDNLVQNIIGVYDYAVEHDKLYIKNLFKLKDHIGLEVGRIIAVDELAWRMQNQQKETAEQLRYTQVLAGQFDEQVRRQKNILEDLQETACNGKEQIKKSEETLENMNSKIESIQKDSITILGIFASIVLSFTAGMVFTSSVLQNIDKASPYRIVGVILVIGMVLTDLIALLLVYIDRIRMVKPGPMTLPKSIKVMNVCYICGFCADFIVWLLLERLAIFTGK